MTSKDAKLKSGLKFDTAKARFDLVDPRFEEEVAKILTYGAAKYDDNNWQLLENGTDRYYAALRRHLNAWWKGEKMDPESGSRHLSHCATCLMFLMWLEMKDEKEKDAK